MPFLCERSGRWSPIKIGAFAAVLLPAAWIVFQAATDELGARPITEAIHQLGDWALRLTWLTLAITPLQRIFHHPRIIVARRILGVAAAAYAGLHISMYVLDQHFDLLKVASEIVLRIYLLIGFLALSGLIALTSIWIWRYGRRGGSSLPLWPRLRPGHGATSPHARGRERARFRVSRCQAPPRSYPAAEQRRSEPTFAGATLPMDLVATLITN